MAFAMPLKKKMFENITARTNRMITDFIYLFTVLLINSYQT